MDEQLDFKRMAIFAEVVNAGSFSGCARRLAMTPSAVSQHVRQLEQQLGLALLHRTTRKISLTEAGQRYVEGCQAMLQAARLATQALARLRDEPEGQLRLAAPVGFASRLAIALAPLRQHPKLSLQLLLDDAVVDLVEQRVDIALRVGQLPDSNLVARKLGSISRQLCAAPSYLAEHGWPAQPEDLLQHDLLSSLAQEPLVLELRNAQGESTSLRLTPRVQATQVTALHALCVSGWGISVGVSHDDQIALQDGRLLPILPGWHLDDVPIYALTQRRTEQAAKVRHVLDLLLNYFAKP